MPTDTAASTPTSTRPTLPSAPTTSVVEQRTTPPRDSHVFGTAYPHRTSRPNPAPLATIRANETPTRMGDRWDLVIMTTMKMKPGIHRTTAWMMILFVRRVIVVPAVSIARRRWRDIRRAMMRTLVRITMAVLVLQRAGIWGGFFECASGKCMSVSSVRMCGLGSVLAALEAFR